MADAASCLPAASLAALPDVISMAGQIVRIGQAMASGWTTASGPWERADGIGGSRRWRPTGLGRKKKKPDDAEANSRRSRTQHFCSAVEVGCKTPGDRGDRGSRAAVVAGVARGVCGVVDDATCSGGTVTTEHWYRAEQVPCQRDREQHARCWLDIGRCCRPGCQRPCQKWGFGSRSGGWGPQRRPVSPTPFSTSPVEPCLSHPGQRPPFDHGRTTSPVLGPKRSSLARQHCI